MEQFRISEGSYNKIRKKWFNITIPIIAVFVVILITSNVLSARNGDLIGVFVAVPVTLAILAYSVSRGLRKQKQLLLSYCVTIDDSEISREQLNTPPLSINFMEIKEIIKTKKGGFMIKGRTSADVIHIPYMIDNAAALEEKLKTFGPITVWEKNPMSMQLRGLLVIVGIAAMIATFTIDNVIISGICGVFVIVMAVWTFILVRKSKNLPDNMKRRSWIYLVFALMIAYFLYLKFGGTPFGR